MYAQLSLCEKKSNNKFYGIFVKNHVFFGGRSNFNNFNFFFINLEVIRDNW